MKVGDISAGTLLRTTGLAAVAGLALSVAAPADAALIATVEGNACGGVLGTPPNCTVPDTIENDDGEIVDVGGDNTPLIAKFDFSGQTGDITEFTQGVFGTIDGSEFSFSSEDDILAGAGTWTYNPNDPEDPAINFYVAKGGPNFNLFSVIGDEDFPCEDDNGELTCGFQTPSNPGGQIPALSNISFYDTARNGNGPGPGPMPEPATLLSLGAGLAGLGLVARRRRRAA